MSARDQTPSDLYDLVVIGTGVAGLYATLELLKARPSLKVALYERTRYIGGRAHTFHKTLPNGKKLQWEAGGARISDAHHRLHALLKKYKLHTYPIKGTVNYVPTYGAAPEPNVFEPMIPIVLESLRSLPPKTLATSTIRELMVKIHGAAKTDEILDRFPYRAELRVMRADEGLALFEHEMRSQEGYSVCAEGLSALTEAMANDLTKRGAKLHTRTTLVDFEQPDPKGPVTLRLKPTEHPPFEVQATRVILAVPVPALSRLLPFKGHPLLKMLEMRPLLRFYGVFPASKAKPAWFEGLPRIVTPTPIRYMIPGSAESGVVQMSYTDSMDTTPIAALIHSKGKDAAAKYIVKELRGLFPDRVIPDPIFIEAHLWDDGVTYWMPGDYDPATESRKALHPLPETAPAVYLCGESYSVRQGWIEGALEHAASLVALLKRRGAK